ncbi:MAG TPA: hypothetical protein VHT52_01805 [Stellaceae bacterium]|jgi:hypothetical protein|nr:hypothetical protein [Stellaceae bacterium]
MPGRTEYQTKAAIAVEALFPGMSEEAQQAIAWLIADFLLSLDAMASADE